MADTNCTDSLAAATDFITNMETVYVVFTALCGAVTIITLLMYTEQLGFLYTHLDHWTSRFHVTSLLSVYPVYSLLSMVTLFMPRSIPINDMISGLYISINLGVFVRLIVGYFGGKRAMNEKLLGQELKLRAPPICCCFFCLPTLLVTPNVTSILQIATLQYSIIRPILAYSMAITFAEKQETFDISVVYSRGIFLSLSTLLAMYGLQLLYRVSRKPLHPIPLPAKFRCLQVVLVIDNLQRSILTTLGSHCIIPCAYGITCQSNSYRIHRMITIFEMVLLSAVARMTYRRHMHQLIRNQAGAEFTYQQTSPDQQAIVSAEELQPPWEHSGERRNTESSTAPQPIVSAEELQPHLEHSGERQNMESGTAPQPIVSEEQLQPHLEHSGERRNMESSTAAQPIMSEELLKPQVEHSGERLNMESSTAAQPIVSGEQLKPPQQHSRERDMESSTAPQPILSEQELQPPSECSRERDMVRSDNNLSSAVSPNDVSVSEMVLI